jgi:beta-phosphoglucomutase
MKYDGIIFDLDGVICHTDEYHYLAWKQIADKMGIYFDEKINNRLRGVSRMDSLEIILERYEGTLNESQKATWAEQKNDRYKELLKHMTPNDLSQEVEETLQGLRSGGIKLAIGSSSKNARLILEQIGLGDFFDAISDGNNIVDSKPNPEVFIKAAQYLDIEPIQCLVVEDAKVGIEAAIAGNMDSAAIGDAVVCKKATYELNSFADLLAICK